MPVDDAGATPGKTGPSAPPRPGLRHPGRQGRAHPVDDPVPARRLQDGLDVQRRPSGLQEQRRRAHGQARGPLPPRQSRRHRLLAPRPAHRRPLLGGRADLHGPGPAVPLPQDQAPRDPAGRPPRRVHALRLQDHAAGQAVHQGGRRPGHHQAREHRPHRRRHPRVLHPPAGRGRGDQGHLALPAHGGRRGERRRRSSSSSRAPSARSSASSTPRTSSRTRSCTRTSPSSSTT